MIRGLEACGLAIRAVAIITGLTLLVTGDFILRSRVIQALELAAGPDWQAVARPVG